MTDEKRLVEIETELRALDEARSALWRERDTINKRLQADLPNTRADELIADATTRGGNPHKIYLWVSTGRGHPEEKLAAFFGGCIPEQKVYYDATCSQMYYDKEPKWSIDTGELMIDNNRLSDIILDPAKFVDMFGGVFGITDPDVLLTGAVKVDLDFVCLSNDGVNPDEVIDVDWKRNIEFDIGSGRYYVKAMWFTLLPSANKVSLAEFDRCS